MVKARIIMAVIILAAMIGGAMAFTTHRGLSNLFMTVTGHFTQNGVGLILTYATISPYRTFPTTATQTTTNVTRPLYTSITVTWTVIGGDAYFYEVVSGTRWFTSLIYEDEGQ